MVEKMGLEGCIGMALLVIAWMIFIADRSRTCRDNGFNGPQGRKLKEVIALSWKAGVLVFLGLVFFYEPTIEITKNVQTSLDLNSYFAVKELAWLVVFISEQILLAGFSVVGWILGGLLHKKYVR